MTVNVTELAEIFIATTDVEAMFRFYKMALDITLNKIDAGEFEYYRGSLGGIGLSLMPNTVAKVGAKENKHELKFKVTDLTQVLSNVVGFGGLQESEPTDEGDRISVHVRDPDGNSLEIFQMHH